MLFEYIKSTVENIKERIKNPFTERNTTPFAGSLIIALVIYNWKLFFTFINFDNTETRLTKIQIISNYLKSESWFYRVGNPILIAFCSIILFYLFNNISLGITTFFNRWVKAFVLQIFDRSKIVAREELERTMARMNKLRINYEDLKRTFTDSQNEIEEFKAQVREKDGKLAETIVSIEKLNTEKEHLSTNLEVASAKLKEVEDDEKTLKVLLARYGKSETYNDVTEIVTKLLISKKKFLVKNTELGGDPLRYVHKELQIFYSFKSKLYSFIAKEYFEVEINQTDGLLVSNETEESKNVYSLDGVNRITAPISDFFKGTWELEYKGRLNGVEDVELREGNKYFAKSKSDTSFKHYFNIENIIINIKEKKLQFTKVGVPPNDRRIDSVLTIVEEGKLYEGKEEDGKITVIYRKT